MQYRSRFVRSRAILLFVLLTLSTPALVAAASNPYDKYRDDAYSNKGLMSEQQEVQLGAQVHQQVLQKFRLVEDPEVAGYVQNLGERLARSSKRPDLPYRFYVIDDPSVNAFALPGGFIYVHTGLLQLAQSEDELAAAVAHEIGHVAARHGLRNLKKAQRTALLFGILGVGADIATGNTGAGRAASQILAAGVITKNSRDFEREADYLGLYNMRAAGESPGGMVRIFERLDGARTARSSQMGGIFASHPDAKERVRNTQVEIDQHLGGASAVAKAAPRSSSTSGRTRARRATVGGGGGAYASNDASFQQMKQALAGYARGNRTYRQGQGQNPRYGGNNPQYDPNQEPIRNDRPVLKRRN